VRLPRNGLERKIDSLYIESRSLFYRISETINNNNDAGTLAGGNIKVAGRGINFVVNCTVIYASSALGECSCVS
jgi:hypothetical protein